VPSDLSEQSSKRNRQDLRIVARNAIQQLLEPLVGFVLDSGLSTNELHSILRRVAVQAVAAKQMEVAQRVNISGIAATTGIPRGEISRILRSITDSPRRNSDRQQQSTNRILAVWHQDPKFTTPAGKPANLKIYGRGVSFEALVRSHGRGIPIRAMLDELIRTGAAEVLPSRFVRAKTSVAIDRGVTARMIRSFGDHASELLSTMLLNMRHPESPKFVASVSRSNVSPDVIPLFRKELLRKGADFLAEIHDSMYQNVTGEIAKRRTSSASRVSVTVFYHETHRKTKQHGGAKKKRHNFRRDV
jgi:Family of unknown function (DUF6502)